MSQIESKKRKLGEMKLTLTKVFVQHKKRRRRSAPENFHVIINLKKIKNSCFLNIEKNAYNTLKLQAQNEYQK